MKEKILNNWSVPRFARLVLGAAAAVQGIVQKEWIVTGAGFFLLAGALFDFGCCGSAGCAVVLTKKQKEKETKYEEVDCP